VNYDSANSVHNAAYSPFEFTVTLNADSCYDATLYMGLDYSDELELTNEWEVEVALAPLTVEVDSQIVTDCGL
jgi:hypothetical protein